VNGELWLRPWAYYAPQHRTRFEDSTAELPDDHAGPLLFWSTGKRDIREGEPLTQFQVYRANSAGSEMVPSFIWELPLPLRTEKGISLGRPGDELKIRWPALPDRPAAFTHEGDTAEPGRELMLRTEAVWDRIQDVDDALTDPSRLWETLYRQWTGQDADEPRMDVIVAQARNLARAIDALERHPRRILRRTHGMVPIGRVQEVDRRAMLWMARQPGDTLAEKAGLDQQLLAVRREENFDTLENRVLRSYTELARRHAADYLDRNRTLHASIRARLVEAHARRCGRLARSLRALGVRLAEPDITPNFVLLENQNYRSIWKAWVELQRLERVRDDLWRWQARSWQEYCRLVIMVALAGLEGGKLIAASPLWYRDDQHRGNWIDMFNPLGVVHLERSDRVVEVATTAAKDNLARLGAPIWLRVGKVGDSAGILQRVAVWPLWSPTGGIVPGEASELHKIIENYHKGDVTGGIILRPSAEAQNADTHRNGCVLALSLGTEGEALKGTLYNLTDFLASALQVETT